MTMNKFETAFQELIGNEGGYKAEKTDRMDWTGGKIGIGILKGTKFGISAGTYPELDIKNLTLDEARNIYKRDWWDRFKGDAMPYEIGFQVFDSEVNHGRRTGVKFLQKALGFKEDDTDGLVGNVTLTAVSKANEDQLLLRYLAVRLRYFTCIPTWNTYGRGWANRVADNLMKAADKNYKE